jgi:CheY-like chemotaxis protein
MRILVVEDEKRVRSFVVRDLEEAGFAVDAAADGNTALELALVNSYDAIALDLMLPGRDGRAFLRVLDSGPGLAAEELERVLERFYSRPTAIGGELRVSSPGGALFELELPAGAS